MPAGQRTHCGSFLAHMRKESQHSRLSVNACRTLNKTLQTFKMLPDSGAYAEAHRLGKPVGCTWLQRVLPRAACLYAQPAGTTPIAAAGTLQGLCRSRFSQSGQGATV